MERKENGEIPPEEETEKASKSFEEEEFIRYCEANNLDYNEEDMDEDDRKGFQQIKKRFIKAVKEKRLVVDGTNLLYTVSKYSPQAGEELVVRRPIGRDFMAMDGFKENQRMQQLNGFIASICGQEKSFIARLDVSDQQFLRDVGTLFLTA